MNAEKITLSLMLLMSCVGVQAGLQKGSFKRYCGPSMPGKGWVAYTATTDTEETIKWLFTNEDEKFSFDEGRWSVNDFNNRDFLNNIIASASTTGDMFIQEQAETLKASIDAGL